MQKVNEHIKLANQYRDEAYTIRDSQYDYPGLSFYYMGASKREDFCWEMFEYYSKEVRNYYKN